MEVYASVTDARGEPVTGLVRDDFEVFEGGTPQPVSVFAAADVPLSVAVALDRSFSMSGPRLAVARSAARVFLGELRPTDESAILAIGSEVETVAPLSTDRVANRFTTGTARDVVAPIDLHHFRGAGRIDPIEVHG